jgi:hypothetical protein
VREYRKRLVWEGNGTSLDMTVEEVGIEREAARLCLYPRCLYTPKGDVQRPGDALVIKGLSPRECLLIEGLGNYQCNGRFHRTCSTFEPEDILTRSAGRPVHDLSEEIDETPMQA